MTEDLTALLARIKEAQGPSERWIDGDNALSMHIAQLGSEERVLARGRVQSPGLGHYPAALMYHCPSGCVIALAPSGPDWAVRRHGVNQFYSTVHYESIAREVFMGGPCSEPGAA